MNKMTVLVLAGLIFGLTGCTTTNHIYDSKGQCLSCWNNPFSGEPINHDGVVKNESGKITNEISFNINGSVVPIYQIIKEEFKYQTRDEIQNIFGKDADKKLSSSDYFYDFGTGRYYHMLARRSHNGHMIKIFTKIEYVHERETSINISFSVDGTNVDPAVMGASLETRVRNAIKL